MPVAGTIRLDVVQEARDKALGVVAKLRQEMKATEQQFERLKDASREDFEVEQLFTKARDKKAQQLANERRASVEAERAARAATETKSREAGVTGAAVEKIQAASRAQEMFNKVLGLAGFVGLLGGALVGLGKLISGLTEYGSAMDRVKETQDEFNALLERISGQNRQERLDSMGSAEREIALAKERQVKATDDLLRAQDLLYDRQNALRINEQMQAEIKARLARESGSYSLMELEDKMSLRRLQDEENRLKTDIREKGGDIAEYQRLTLEYARQATPEYREQARQAKAIADETRRIMDGAQQGIDLAKKAASDAITKAAADRERAAAAGAAQADRVRGLERELELSRATNENDRSAIRMAEIQEDLRRGVISAREAELRTTIEREKTIAQIKADREKKEAEYDALQKKRAETAATARKRAGEKNEEQAAKDAADALKAKGKEVERLGGYAEFAASKLGLLNERLGAISGEVRNTTAVWAEYATGQATVGDAITSTIGSTGVAIASAIKDKKAQAAVEGAFESAASIAAFASLNIPAGIAHAAAATAFFAVAAGGGASGGAKGGAPSAAPSSAAAGGSGGGGFGLGSSRSSDRREVIIVQYNSGIVYGMGSDVAKAAAGAGQSLRSTGMHRRRF